MSECGAHWLPEDERRWRAFLAGIEPEELEVPVYCPVCAEREFGENEADA